MLTGDLGDTCDIVTLLYEKDLSFKNYRGLKGQYISGAAYVFQMSTLGMGLQAAKISMRSNEADHWQFAQSKFQLKHRTALYRMQNYYNIAINETVHNSQMNFVKFIRLNPEYFVSPNYDNITQGVQYALSIVAPNKDWFVQVYEAKTDYDQF